MIVLVVILFAAAMAFIYFKINGTPDALKGVLDKVTLGPPPSIEAMKKKADLLEKQAKEAEELRQLQDRIDCCRDRIAAARDLKTPWKRPASAATTATTAQSAAAAKGVPVP